MMDSVRLFFRNLIKYFIYIAVFAQIVSGTVYLVCNFTDYICYPETEDILHVARGLLFDEYTGILYPLFVRVCLNIQSFLGLGYYLVVHLVQLFFFGSTAGYLVKTFFSGKKVWIVTAYIVSFPMCLQSILMVSPFAFKAGFGFLIVGAMVRLWKAGCKMSNWILLLVAYMLSALNVTDDLYMWLLPIGIFAIAQCLRKKNASHIGRRVCLLLTVILIFFATFGVLNHTVRPGARGRMQRTVSSVLFQRTVWPEFRMKFAFLPLDVLEYIESNIALESDSASEMIMYQIGPTIDREYGFERANELYMESFINQLGYNKRAIFKAVLNDFTGYLFHPYSTIWYMNGQEGSAFSTVYGLMSAKNPKMTHFYFCIAFVSMFVLTFERVLHLIKQEYKTHKSGLRKGLLFAGILIFQAMWYSIANVQGVDYRYGLLNVAIFSLFVLGDKVFETTTGIESKKKFQIGKKVACITGVGILCVALLGLCIAAFHKGYKKSDLLKDKEVVCLGDSIWGLVNDETGLASLVEEMTGAKVSNYAISGTTASEVSDMKVESAVSDKSLIQIIDSIETGDFGSEIFENADYLIIAYGLNDYFLGVPIETKQHNDVKTYKGALSYAVKYFQEKYPDLKIVLVGQTYCQFYSYGVVEEDSDTHDFGGGVGMDYVKAAEEVAKANNLIFVNQYEELPIHKWNGTLYLEDATHLNEKGRIEYAKVVSKYILKDYKERNAR